MSAATGNPRDAIAVRTAAGIVMTRIAEIAQYTDKPGEVLRTFLSPAMEALYDHLRLCFEQAGMTVHVDSVGNFRALYSSQRGSLAPRLIIGSHLDTVPNAGAYDGVLGVLVGLALVEGLSGRRFSYSIEVVGFSDEEGTRFGIPFLGSRALTGELCSTLLDTKDSSGLTVREALDQYRRAHPEAIEAGLIPGSTAYLEFHIEQGPVLESLDLSLGVVEAVAGQSRLLLTFHGQAGHAGTSPMSLRRDALATAAQWITQCEAIAVETSGLVATVGQITAEPGAVNVVPGLVRCSLDIRHADDSVRRQAVEKILDEARMIATQRGISVEATEYHTQQAVRFDSGIVRLAEKAVKHNGQNPIRMTSGAGHDAMVIAPHLPAAMIFLRSPGGVSHHPDETVLVQDVEAAIHAGLCFFDEFEDFLAKKENEQHA